MKNIFTTIATVALLMMTSVTSFAGAWKNNATGWWYDYGNGGYPAACWQWIDGNNDGIAECYYFDQYGYMLANASQDGYMVNADGQWTLNGIVQMKNVVGAQLQQNTTATQEIVQTTYVQKKDTVNDEGEASDTDDQETTTVKKEGKKQKKSGKNLLEYKEGANNANMTSDRTINGKQWLNAYRIFNNGGYLRCSVGGEYDTLTFDYAPEDNYSKDAVAIIQVHGDEDELLWESDKVKVTSKTQSATVDVSGQDNIRIHCTKISGMASNILFKSMLLN